MHEPSLKISSIHIGKVLSQATQGTTQESQQMRQMIAGRFEDIMAIVEADVSMKLLVNNCVTNPNSTDCIGVFRKSLLKILADKQTKGGEKSKRVSGPDGLEETEGDQRGDLGIKIQALYLDDWHSGEKVAKFSTLAVEYIDLFIELYDYSHTDEDDEDDDEDSRDIPSVDRYDMMIVKILVSAAQSYLGYRCDGNRGEGIEDKRSSFTEYGIPTKPLCFLEEYICRKL